MEARPEETPQPVGQFRLADNPGTTPLYGRKRVSRYSAEGITSGLPVIRPQSSGAKWSGFTVGAQCGAPDRRNANQTAAGPTSPAL
jgi:hypothetical protein